MTDQEMIQKVIEEAKKKSGEEISVEDAQAAIDFIKDQKDFDLCAVIQEAIDGNPKRLKKLRKDIEKINNMPIYIAGGVAVAAVAVLAAPAVMAALPVLSGGAAASAGVGATTAAVVAADGVTIVGSAVVTDLAVTTGVATVATTGGAAATGGVLSSIAAAGSSAVSAIGAAGSAAVSAAGSAITGGGVLTAGEAAASYAIGAAAATPILAAEIAAAPVLADKTTATYDASTAAVAGLGVSKTLNKKDIVSVLSTTLLTSDICQVVKDVAYYDVAINQGNTKLLEANHKINPVYEEALWEVSDYDTQLYFVNTELARYSIDKEKLKKIIERGVSEITGVTKGYKDTIVLYCNLVTSDNKMYMYVLMFNHEWFKHPTKNSEIEKAMEAHCKELLAKHGITEDKIRYLSLTAGVTLLTNKEFINGKDVKEPLSLYREGSRLRIPDLEKTESLTKAKEGDAVAANTIVGNIISNLSCEYVLNNLNKQATVYKFMGDVKSIKDAVLKTTHILELSPLLCGDRKIRNTISKLKDRVGRVDSLGLVIIPDVGMATVNVLSGTSIIEQLVDGTIDKGLIITFTSAAGVSIETSLTHVQAVYLFWSMLGAAEKSDREKSEDINQAQLDVADRNRGALAKIISPTEYTDKEGRKFLLGSERVSITPSMTTLVGSYLSDDGTFRLTYRTLPDKVFLKNKRAFSCVNYLIEATKQGSFMKPKTTVHTDTVKNLDKVITPDTVVSRLLIMCKSKKKSDKVLTILLHDKHKVMCHIFDYYADGECSLPIEEIKEFAEFPFTIDGESIIIQQNRFDMFTF